MVKLGFVPVVTSQFQPAKLILHLYTPAEGNMISVRSLQRSRNKPGRINIFYSSHRNDRRMKSYYSGVKHYF